MISYRGEKFKGYNRPKLTPGKSKKAAVLARMKVGGKFKVKLVRFGDPNSKHNYSASARERFKSRFRSLIEKNKRNKFSAMYWANAFLWKKGGSVKRK